jgi:hypothetical protein
MGGQIEPEITSRVIIVGVQSDCKLADDGERSKDEKEG